MNFILPAPNIEKLGKHDKKYKFFRIKWFDDPPTDRPYYFLIKNDFTVDDEIHKWFLDNNITYSIKYNGNWNILLDNINDVMIYKLTWL